MTKIRVMIIDDHAVVRQGLCSLLSEYPDIKVVGEAEDSVTALELITSLCPDIVLLDIRLAGTNGLELARQLHASQSKVRVIILTSYDDECYLLAAAQAGVHGYLLKSASAETVHESLRKVYSGERQLSPTLAGKALRQLAHLSQAPAGFQFTFSDEELHLLRLMSEGASTAEMASTLHLSERTIKRRTHQVFVKLGANSRAQAVAEAFRRGLL